MTRLEQDVASLNARYSEPADTIRSHIYFISCIKNTQHCLRHWSRRTRKNAEVKTRQDLSLDSVTVSSGENEPAIVFCFQPRLHKQSR